MGDTTISPQKCGACGRVVSDGCYYIKNGVTACITCTLKAEVGPEQAKALEDDSAIKSAVLRTLSSVPCSKPPALDEVARALAVELLQVSQKVVSVSYQDPSPEQAGQRAAVLDEVKEAVEIASMLDLLVDKFIARKG